MQKCQYFRVLTIKSEKDRMCNYEQVDRILGSMSSDLLSKLTCLSLKSEGPITSLSAPSMFSDPLAISIYRTNPEDFHKYLNVLLPKYNLLKRNPQVYARVQFWKRQDLSTLMTKHIKHLHLVRNDRMERDSHVTLFVSGKFPHCPQLTQHYSRRL